MKELVELLNGRYTLLHIAVMIHYLHLQSYISEVIK